MKVSILNLFILAFLLFFPAGVYAQNGKLHTVNDSGDTNDSSVGDGFCADAGGKCTLRAAIQEANADSFQDAVIFALPQPATINLTLGELNIASNIYIAGPGARNLTVQRSFAPGTPQFRIFHVEFTGSSPIPVTIRALTIKNGSTKSDGGAIYTNYQTTVNLADIAVTNNTAASGGGIFAAGTLFLTRSLVSSNISTGLYGGGIISINPQGTSIISNSTFTGNSGSQGGAIYNIGALLLVNNTITNNAATSAGSSVMNDSPGTVNVLNTIIGMDTSSTISSLSGAFSSFGNNLITDARNSTGFTNGVAGDQVSNNNKINPLLGNLADNGGQTDTRALLEGSPAINQGNNCIYNATCPQPFPPGYRLSTDQRIPYLRQSGAAVDIGAFESQTLIFSSNIGLGGIGNRTRAGTTMLILTKASTNEKQTHITNPFGNFRFNNLTFGDVYILERKPKRFGEPRGLGIFAFDNLPAFPQPVTELEAEDIKIIWDKFSARDK